MRGRQTYGSQTTQQTYGNHVCLSAFPGARSACAGSQEAKALIKEPGWYWDASLSACGTHSLMGSRWKPPDWTSSSKPAACWCTNPVRSSSSFSPRVYLRIWRLSRQIKAPFSFDGAAKFSLHQSQDEDRDTRRPCVGGLRCHRM